jgi:cytochrome P450
MVEGRAVVGVKCRGVGYVERCKLAFNAGGCLAEAGNNAAGLAGRAMTVGQRAAVMTTLLPIGWGPRSTRIVKAATSRLDGVPGGVDGLAGRLIAARRAHTGTGHRARDLLDVLLQARDEHGTPLTDAEIGDEIATFLMAGHETSANTLAWTLALLSAYPAARRRVEAELDQMLGGRDPEAEDVAGLPWTRAVISEALRLYPPAWTIERDALAADNVRGVAVPAGSLVAISPYLVHRHPAFWPDPAGFDPTRFLPGGDRRPGHQAPVCVHPLRRRQAGMRRRMVRRAGNHTGPGHHRPALPAGADPARHARPGRTGHFAARPQPAHDPAAAVMTAAAQGASRPVTPPG